MHTKTSREKQTWTKPALASLNVGDAAHTPPPVSVTKSHTTTTEFNLVATGPNS
jgi:hypothetical protein